MCEVLDKTRDVFGNFIDVTCVNALFRWLRCMERTATAGRCGFLQEPQPGRRATCWCRRLTAATRKTGPSSKSIPPSVWVRRRGERTFWPRYVEISHTSSCLHREVSGGPRGCVGGSGDLVSEGWHEVYVLQELRQVRVLQEANGMQLAVCLKPCDNANLKREL